MQTQRQMMDGIHLPLCPPFLLAHLHYFTEQDTQLETLSHSIRRQRELSENIGNELDVHTGLLEDLESGLDNTALRLGGARRKLDTVAKGARDNCKSLIQASICVARIWPFACLDQPKPHSLRGINCLDFISSLALFLLFCWFCTITSFTDHFMASRSQLLPSTFSPRLHCDDCSSYYNTPHPNHHLQNLISRTEGDLEHVASTTPTTSTNDRLFFLVSGHWEVTEYSCRLKAVPRLSCARIRPARSARSRHVCSSIGQFSTPYCNANAALYTRTRSFSCLMDILVEPTRHTQIICNTPRARRRCST